MVYLVVVGQMGRYQTLQVPVGPVGPMGHCQTLQVPVPVGPMGHCQTLQVPVGQLGRLHGLF